jgi:formamidopyrimidine-DNA glycosylase
MPELPEVETVRRGLAPILEGRLLVRVEQRRPDLRIPFPAGFVTRLEGRRVIGLRRRAKYLLFDLDDGTVMIAHLGMSGRMLVRMRGSNAMPETHDHVVLHTDRGDSVVYNDARRFGLMTLTTRADESAHPLLRHLAPDPTEDIFDGAHLARALAGKHTPIKAALLDQTVIGGVGNIYASEALHRAGISPRRLARSIKRQRADRLAGAVRDVIAEAISAGGSSLRDYVQTDGELGYFQHSWRVYDREGEGCRTAGCHGLVKRIVQSNRSTFYCGICQR